MDFFFTTRFTLTVTNQNYLSFVLKLKKNLRYQRWSEGFNSDVVSAVVKGATAARAELRAAALQVISALAHYAQLMAHLMQGETL